MTNLGIYYQRIQPDAVFTPAAVYFNLVVPAENHLCLTLLRLNVSASYIACIDFYMRVFYSCIALLNSFACMFRHDYEIQCQ